MKKTLQLRNCAFLLLAAMIWGMGFVAQSVGMENIGPYTFNCLRNLIGGIFLIPCIPLLAAMDRKGNPENTKVVLTKEEEQKAKKELLLGGLCCGLALCLASNFQQLGVQYTDAVGKAGFITAFYIILVPILGLFIKKRCGYLVWIGVAMSLAGLYFLCIKDSFTIQKGDILVFICAIFYAVHILVIDYFTQRVDGVKMSCIQFFVAGILTAIPMFILETPRISEILTAWLPLLYTGVLCSGVGFTLQIVGQKGMNPTIASMLLSLESVFSVLAGLVILGQKLSGREILGCVLMFCAIILAQLPQKEKKIS